MKRSIAPEVASQQLSTGPNAAVSRRVHIVDDRDRDSGESRAEEEEEELSPYDRNGGKSEVVGYAEDKREEDLHGRDRPKLECHRQQLEVNLMEALSAVSSPPPQKDPATGHEKTGDNKTEDSQGSHSQISSLLWRGC